MNIETSKAERINGRVFAGVEMRGRKRLIIELEQGATMEAAARVFDGAAWIRVTMEEAMEG